MTVNMTDLDVLERFAFIMGVGQIHPRQTTRPNCRSARALLFFDRNT
jgi:hypothetical protein